MPGCSTVQVLPTSGKTSAPFRQRIENTGTTSVSARRAAFSARGRAQLPAAIDAADFAGRNAAAAWQARYLDWMETGLPCTSTDLLPRLPFTDTVQLAALVGTGRMTWPEVNAALDAMIKLAAADALDGQPHERLAPPTQHTAAPPCESEIWARYHAQCDAVFAKEGCSSEPDERSQLWATERVLDRLRSIRDRELAALRRQMAQRAPDSMSWNELAPGESRALGKLGATGFAASGAMIAAIDDLISESAASSSDRTSG